MHSLPIPLPILPYTSTPDFITQLQTWDHHLKSRPPPTEAQVARAIRQSLYASRLLSYKVLGYENAGIEGSRFVEVFYGPGWP